MLQEQIRILYVDDDEDDFLLVQTLLQKVRRSLFAMDRAATYDEALGKLHNEYDLFLVDYKLGKENGLELLQAIKSRKKYAPVIMLTGMENGELDIQAMREGAADYLIKGDFDAEMLHRTIRYAIRDAILLQTLEISANRFRNIFERAADPIILIDSDGMMKEANPAFVNRFGYNPEELDRGASFFSMITISDHVELITETIKKDEELNDLETSLHVADDGQIDVLISVVMHDSQAKMYQVMIKDLTSLRIKEEETRNLKRFSSTGRIARIIAHEVKNPLTNITLSADQLKVELPEEVYKETGDLIEIIQRNCTRINQLVSELLYSTRFSELQTSKHSINVVLEEALEMAKDRLNLKKIKVLKRYDDGICDIDVDSEKIKIAFLNLIVNAIEAMEQESGVLSVSTYVKDSKCFIEISDNGSGIASEHLEHLFEPFFTNKEKGTGLGLTNTQNIILSHKGSIRVKSDSGRGTTFIVSLNLN
ncbi:MAG: response regulator [Chitinophagaceae bacterium]|nr:response regulator [Chitinophagaceae bacterium]